MTQPRRRGGPAGAWPSWPAPCPRDRRSVLYASALHEGDVWFALRGGYRGWPARPPGVGLRRYPASGHAGRGDPGRPLPGRVGDLPAVRRTTRVAAASPEERWLDRLFHDLPVAVAGRAVGVFGAVNAADRLLVSARPSAIRFASQVVGLATGTIASPPWRSRGSWPASPPSCPARGGWRAGMPCRPSAAVAGSGGSASGHDGVTGTRRPAHALRTPG